MLGGCSLYFGDPPASRQPPTLQPPAAPPSAGGTGVPYAQLATGPRDVMDIAVDDSYVYWLVNHQQSNQSDVFRVAKSGGASELVAHVDGRVYQFALDDAYVYLPVYAQTDAGGPFLRVPKIGGAFEVLDDHLRYLYLAAVHDGAAYTAPLVDESTIDYELWRYPNGNGAHEVVMSGLRGPESLALDRDDVYVTSEGDSKLMQAPMGGGNGVEPLSSLMALRVQSDGDRIYFLSGAVDDCSQGRISAWRPGDAAMTDLGLLGTCAHDLALTTQAVIAIGDHDVVQFPLDGSGPATLVDGLSAPMAVAVEPDGSAIYFGDYETGEIDRLDL